MPHMHVKRVVLLGMAGLLSACAQLRPDTEHQKESAEQVSRVDLHSSFPAVRRPQFEQVNLIELVDPHREAETRFPLAWDLAMRRLSTDQVSSIGLRYDLALAAFRERPDNAVNPKQAHRDAVQDRILSVSTSRCNVFKTYLRRQQAETNFWLGSSATAAGVLGAVLQGATASRNLAGTAGLLSGLQAEHNSNYYSNLAAHVIVQGIETHQARLLAKLIEERRKRAVDEYSMEAAIKDAIHFDGTCSTVTGLLEAAEAIKETTNPGIPRAAEIIASVRAMNMIAQAQDFTVLRESGELQQLLKQTSPATSPLVVSTAGPQTMSDNTLQRLNRAGAAPDRLTGFVREQLQALRLAFQIAQDKLGQTGLDAEGRKRVEQALTDAAQPLANTSALVSCVGRLVPSSTAYASAIAKRDLTVAGTLDRINADAEVLRMRLGAIQATEQVERVLSHLQAVARSQADSWREELVKAKPQAANLMVSDARKKDLVAQSCSS